MAQTHEGAMKVAAKLAGLSYENYMSHIKDGEKRCQVCKTWKADTEFNRDRSRGDGLASLCRGCQNALARKRYIPADVRGRKPFGPKPLPAREGDKIQARARINKLVKNGRLPNPNDVRCKRCGHIGSDRRHEYHHYKGYGKQHHLDVIVQCTKCHRIADPVWKSRKRNDKGQFYGRAN